MMVPLSIILTALIVQSTCSYSDDSYQAADPDNPYLYPEEPLEDDFEVRRRNNNHFLRFGRAGKKLDPDYDDYPEDFARPTRSGKLEKSDYFIRFGRSKQDFLRFGRDPRIATRDRNSNHLRFGRSTDNKRSKREAYSSGDFKRAGSNFLRFGRNNNFLRFGRNDGANDVASTQDPEKIQQIRESPLIELLTELIENSKKKERAAPCNRAV